MVAKKIVKKIGFMLPFFLGLEGCVLSRMSLIAAFNRKAIEGGFFLRVFLF
jgi:hypothetical protein